MVNKEKKHYHSWEAPYKLIFFGKDQNKKLYFRVCRYCRNYDEVPKWRRRAKFEVVKNKRIFYDTEELKSRDKIIG